MKSLNQKIVTGGDKLGLSNFSNFFITPPKTFQLSLGVAGKRNTNIVSFVTILPIFAAKRPDYFYPQAFCCDYPLRLVVFGEKGHFWKRFPEWKLLKTQRIRILVNAKNHKVLTICLKALARLVATKTLKDFSSLVSKTFQRPLKDQVRTYVNKAPI